MIGVMTSTTPDLLVVAVLVSLATYRLTVLIIRDKITESIRDWIDRHLYGELVNYFTRCPWCLSVWIGAALTAAADAWWLRMPWFAAVLIAATASAVTGILFEKV